MPYKDKVQQKEYQKQWYQRKKAGLPTRLTPIPTEEEKREKRLKSRRRAGKPYRRKRKEYIDKHLGNRCWLCDYPSDLVCHRKDGIKHKLLSHMGLAPLEKEISSNEYVRLCQKCHGMVHWCMVLFGFDWNTIQELRNREVVGSIPT